MRAPFESPALRLSLLYLAISVLWITFSDRLVDQLFDGSLLTAAQTYKGLAFVFVTAVVLYLLIRREIERARAAERQVKDVENQLGELLSLALSGVIEVDEQWQIVRMNRAAEVIFGYSAAEAEGLSLSRLLPPELNHDRALGDMVGYESEPRNQRVYFDVVGQRRDGEQRAMECVVGPLQRSTGHRIIVIRDVSEQTQAQAALEASEAKYRELVEAAPDGIMITDVTGQILMANTSMCRMLGYTRDELLEMNSVNLLRLGEVAAHPPRMREIAELRGEVAVFERRMARKDGSLVQVESRAKQLPDGTLQAIIRDISERKAAEAALREQKELLQQVFDHIPLFIVIFDQNNRLEMVNREWERVMGWTQAEALAHPNILAEFYEDPAEIERVVNSIGADFAWMEFKTRTRTGNVIDTMWANIPLSDGRNIAVGQDVTDRKAAEAALIRINTELEERVARRTAELQAANKRLVELDELRKKFIAHISHELRNPVASLMMRLHIMGRAVPAPYSEHVVVLQEQTDRLKAMIDSVLDLSRLELSTTRVEFAPVDLNAIVEQEARAFVSHAKDVGLGLVVSVADELPPVLGQAAQLAQVVSNLLSNAVRYTSQGGITVSTQLDPDARQAVLQVRDTGMGIDAADLPHLFERFFRGRRVSESNIAGTGLGLSIVREIVELHGGTISVDSTVNEGATFTVRLPLATEAS